MTVQSAFTIIQPQLRDAHARSWCQELWPGEAGWDITLYQTRGSGGDSGHWSRVTVVLVTGDHCVCVDRRLPTEEMRSLGWPSATVLCPVWGWVWRGKSPAAALTPESSFHRRHRDTERDNLGIIGNTRHLLSTRTWVLTFMWSFIKSILLINQIYMWICLKYWNSWVRVTYDRDTSLCVTVDSCPGSP